MTGCSKGLSHALFSASQNVTTGPHGATNKHWLSCELIIHSNEGVVRRESTGGSLPVHQQRPFLPIHHVLLHFGDIVRHIIDHMQVQVIRGCVEDFGKSL